MTTPGTFRNFSPLLMSFVTPSSCFCNLTRNLWMPTMPEKLKDRESDADLAAWAKDVAAAVTPAELVRLVKDYREQARNSRRSEADREFAKRRGKALAKFVKRNR